MSKDLTTAQIENILIDTGVVYINYGVTGERILAPTRGGNTFNVEQEIRLVERDGAKGKEKGLRRIETENASLVVNLMDMSLANLNVALPGTSITGDKLTATGKMSDSDYLTNITLIGDTLGGDTKVITLYNALSDEGIEISAEDKDEASIEVTFSAHYNPTDVDSPLYEIEDVAGANTYDVTFTVMDNQATPVAVEDALIYMDGKAKLTNSSGVAVYYSLPNATYAYTVAKDGYVTVGDNAVVSSADLAVAVTLNAV